MWISFSPYELMFMRTHAKRQHVLRSFLQHPAAILLRDACEGQHKGYGTVRSLPLFLPHISRHFHVSSTPTKLYRSVSTAVVVSRLAPCTRFFHHVNLLQTRLIPPTTTPTVITTTTTSTTTPTTILLTTLITTTITIDGSACCLLRNTGSDLHGNACRPVCGYDMRRRS